jgi:Zn-finger nucleic acid-binding protein
MGDPYRTGLRWLVCPRCDEVLDEIMPGGNVCPRCAGVWIAKPVLDAAVTSPHWPGGSNMWWRAELACPDCASRGRIGSAAEIMNAIETHGVIVDRCDKHGMWFDAGELSRVMETEGDALAELRDRVKLTREQIEASRVAYARKRAAVVRVPYDAEDIKVRLAAKLEELSAARDRVAALQAEVDVLNEALRGR